MLLHYATGILWTRPFSFSETAMRITHHVFILRTVLHEVVLFLHHFIWSYSRIYKNQVKYFWTPLQSEKFFPSLLFYNHIFKWRL